MSNLLVRFSWLTFVALALISFIAIHRLLLPSGVPYAEIPTEAKIYTSLGIVGFFTASAGVGVLLSGGARVIKNLMRRQQLQPKRMILGVALTAAGAIGVALYWNWLGLAVAGATF